MPDRKKPLHSIERRGKKSGGKETIIEPPGGGYAKAHNL